jgi:cytochrome P450
METSVLNTAKDVMAQIREQKRVDHQTFEVDDVYEFQFKNVARTILSLTYGHSPESEELIQNSNNIFNRSIASGLSYLVVNYVPGGNKLPIPAIQRYVKSTQRAKELQAKILSNIRASNPDDKLRSSFLGRLEQSNRDQGSVLSDDELHHNALGFGVGGNDSTSSGMTSLLWMLATHPDIQTKLRQTCQDNPTKPSENQYLKAVVNESLRLFPPFPSALLRTVQEDLVLGEYQIPKGTLVHIKIMEINRDPKLWYRPTEFLPERFLSDSNTPEEPKRNPLDSMTFGMGKRSCIGARLARTLLQAWTSEMVKTFKISPTEPQAQVNFVDQTGLLKPKPTLKLRFTQF